MVGFELNGLVLPKKPETVSGSYRFSVLERYYGKKRDKSDLNVTYHVNVPEVDVSFHEIDGGVVLNLRPSAFDFLCERQSRLGINDLSVYPVL